MGDVFPIRLFNNALAIDVFPEDPAPNNVTLYNLWDQFIAKKEHIAIVIDEYGGIDGIVTMEDVIETLLGLEITDENDVVVDMQKYAKERWKKRREKDKILNKFK